MEEINSFMTMCIGSMAGALFLMLLGANITRLVKAQL